MLCYENCSALLSGFGFFQLQCNSKCTSSNCDWCVDLDLIKFVFLLCFLFFRG